MIAPPVPDSQSRYRRSSLMAEDAVTRITAPRERRRQLRDLVARIDETVDACEEAQLRNGRTPTDDLIEDVRYTLREATGPVGTVSMVLTAHGRPRHIGVLLEELWRVQDRVFDLLIPWRAALGDNDEGRDTPAATSA